MFTLFVIQLIVLGVCCAVLIKMIKDTRAQMLSLKKQVERLQARLDGITNVNEE